MVVIVRIGTVDSLIEKWGIPLNERRSPRIPGSAAVMNAIATAHQDFPGEEDHRYREP